MDEVTTGELVPALKNPNDISSLPIEQRGALITQALVESKSWLAVATKGTDPTPIAEFKAWAATVAEMTRQKGLAEEIQLDALEMVRRAERGIGLALRNGQGNGDISRHGGPRGNQYVAKIQQENLGKPKPSDFFSGGGVQAETYALADGVTDEEFEEAIGEAREEGNLGRRNVIRKLKGESATGGSRAAPKAGLNLEYSNRKRDRHKTVGVSALRHVLDSFDALEIVLDTANDQLDPDIDSEQAAQWRDSLSRGHGAYGRVMKLLKQRMDGAK